MNPFRNPCLWSLLDVVPMEGQDLALLPGHCEILKYCQNTSKVQAQGPETSNQQYFQEPGSDAPASLLNGKATGAFAHPGVHSSQLPSYHIDAAHLKRALGVQGNLLLGSGPVEQNRRQSLQMHTQLKWYRGDSIAQINPNAIREVPPPPPSPSSPPTNVQLLP